MPAMFDHEKLDVYQLELQFIAWAAPFVAEVTARAKVKTSDIMDHLNRASISALFNTAEGNGKRQRQTRAKFFDDARGSVGECAATLDALVARGACTPARTADGKEMLRRIFQMLTKLVQLYDSAAGVREGELPYGSGPHGDLGAQRAVEEEQTDDDDEDDDEDD